MEPLVRSGRLTAVEYIPGTRTQRNEYRCICDCGSTYTIACNDFRKGKQKSCGCLKRERMSALKRTHNKSRSPEYSVWHAMKDRCYNQRSVAFHYYGARGVTVCETWRESFQCFYDDMGPRPSPNHSLDRVDNSRGYSPDNCQWKTSAEQSRNRRSTRQLTAFGKTQCVVDWAVEYGLTIPSLFARLRKGIPLEDALTIPLNDYHALRHAKSPQFQARKAK